MTRIRGQKVIMTIKINGTTVVGFDPADIQEDIRFVKDARGHLEDVPWLNWFLYNHDRTPLVAKNLWKSHRLLVSDLKDNIGPIRAAFTLGGMTAAFEVIIDLLGGGEVPFDDDDDLVHRWLMYQRPTVTYTSRYGKRVKEYEPGVGTSQWGTQSHAAHAFGNRPSNAPHGYDGIDRSFDGTGLMGFRPRAKPPQKR